METVIIEKDIQIVCLTAKSFPEGIQDAHQQLHAIIPFSKERRYFGLSRPENGIIVYKAAAEVLENDKEASFNCESMVIEKGNYRCMTILEYKKDLQRISKAFEELLSYNDFDPNGYCIEWYHSDEDLKCMVRLKTKNQ